MTKKQEAGKKPKSGVYIEVTEAQKKALKIYAAQEGKTLAQILMDGVKK